MTSDSGSAGPANLRQLWRAAKPTVGDCECPHGAKNYPYWCQVQKSGQYLLLSIDSKNKTNESPRHVTCTKVCYGVCTLFISGSYVRLPFEKDSVKRSRIQGLLLNHMAIYLAAPQTSSFHFRAAIAPTLTSYWQPTAYLRRRPRLYGSGLSAGFYASCHASRVPVSL